MGDEQCLDDNVAGLFASGALSKDERTAVEEHVDRCSGCRRLLAELSRHSGVATDAPALLQSGTEVGRYVIEGVVGVGAMGVVYAAHDPQLARRVALKLLRPVVADDESARQRLVQEALTLARLSHPNIVTVYDSGPWQDQVFVAMELVEGGTLSEWLWKEPRSLVAILRAFRAVGEGLGAAHAAGIIHRDVKPDNVVVGTDGRVRITDFGLARGAGEGGGPGSPAAASFRTDSGMALGTPAYMAPEQRAGQSADPRSDQYSFAVALWEAATGRLPAQQKMPSHPTAPPERPLPGRIARALERAMAADPALRWPSMAALVAALEWDPEARRRQLATVAGLVVVVAAAGAVAYRDHTRLAPCKAGDERVDRALSRARLAELAAGAHSDVERRMVERLSAWRSEWVTSYRDACTATRVRGDQSEALLERRMECLDAHLTGVDTVAALLQSGGRTTAERLIAGGAPEPLDVCADAPALMASLSQPLTHEHAATMRKLDGDLAKARAFNVAARYRDGARLTAAVMTSADESGLAGVAAEARYWDAVSCSHLGDVARAQDETARAGAEAAAVGRDDVVARAYGYLGYLLGSQRRHFDAAYLALDMAAAAVTRGGSHPAQQVLVLRMRASVLTNEGRHREAVEMYRRALDLQRRSAPDTFFEAEIQTGLARSCIEDGRPTEALAAIERARAIYLQLFGADYPRLDGVELQRGFILRQLGRGEEALAAMRRALALRETSTGAENPGVVEALVYVGDLLTTLGRPAEGAAALERAIAVGERIQTPYPDVAAALIYLGWTDLKLGRPAAARRDFERALAHPKASELTSEIGAAKLGLAELVWDEDRRRALALSQEAKKLLADEHNLSQHKAELERWMATHH